MRCCERAGIRHPRQFAASRRRDRPARDGEGAARARLVRARVLLGVDRPQEYDATSARLIAEGVVTPRGARAVPSSRSTRSARRSTSTFSTRRCSASSSSAEPTRDVRRTSKAFVTCRRTRSTRSAASGMRLEEAGHIAATILESMLEPAFAMGERSLRPRRERARRASSARSHCNASSRPDRPRSSSATTSRCACPARRERAIRPTQPIAGVATSRWASASRWNSSWRATPIGSKRC